MTIPTEIADHRRFLSDVWPLEGLVSHIRSVPIRADRPRICRSQRDRHFNGMAFDRMADNRRRQQAKRVDEPPATKDDIADVRAELEALRQATRAEIAAVRADMEAFRRSTKAELESIRLAAKADLHRSTAETKAQFVKWMLIAVCAQSTVIIGATWALGRLAH